MLPQNLARWELEKMLELVQEQPLGWGLVLVLLLVSQMLAALNNLQLYLLDNSTVTLHVSSFNPDIETDLLISSLSPGDTLYRG